MSKNKSDLTIVYLSGETYTIKNTKSYGFVGVVNINGVELYYQEAKAVPDNIDRPESKLKVSYYNPKRKSDITESIPTADIEVIVIREKGGKRIEAIRLHRSKNPSTEIILTI